MPLELTEVEQLRDYLCGVMDRAEHHAGDVHEVVLTIAGAIIWCKDEAPLEALLRQGETKNVIWVVIGGRRYAFSYNHDAETIEMREGSTQGEILRSFTNADSASEVREYFSSLKRSV